MIKARKGNALFLALDRENIDRLLTDQPIYIKGEDILLSVDIIIIANETLAECKEDLRSIGVI